MWAASLDPALVLLLASFGGLIALGAKVGPAISGIRDAFDGLGGGAKKNQGPVDDLADALAAVGIGDGSRRGDQSGDAVRNSERVRKQYWSNANLTSPGSWAETRGFYDQQFQSEIIGALPRPVGAPRPETSAYRR